MRLLYVPLRPDELARLKEIALEQRRRPQDQAAVLLAEALGLNRPTSPVAAPMAPALQAEHEAHDAPLAVAR